jgi:hypothetical protein
MTHPSIGSAARQMGTHPSALIHQFQRLEHDIGAPSTTAPPRPAHVPDQPGLRSPASPGPPRRPRDRTPDLATSRTRQPKAARHQARAPEGSP